jgi:hypothetical protein
VGCAARPQARHYVHRINRAIDHVTRHLAEPLPLEDVARVACCSPFHFTTRQLCVTQPDSAPDRGTGAAARMVAWAR